MHLVDSFGSRNVTRGEDQRSEGFFSFVRLESRIPADHPLRAIRELVDAALRELSRSFDRLYAREGRRMVKKLERRKSLWFIGRRKLLKRLTWDNGWQAFYAISRSQRRSQGLGRNLGRAITPRLDGNSA